MDCQKDIIGNTCECKSCKPRSDKQLANDKMLRYRAAKRARMEELPSFVEDLRNEVNIDPFINSLAPDPLIDEIGGFTEYLPACRGDYVVSDYLKGTNIYPTQELYKVGDKYITIKESKVASLGMNIEPKKSPPSDK